MLCTLSLANITNVLPPHSIVLITFVAQIAI
jgi:hypothetical protein